MVESHLHAASVTPTLTSLAKQIADCEAAT